MEQSTPCALSYRYILSMQQKGLRNGNWRKLDLLEKALYAASLSLARMRGRLVNSRLITNLRGIIAKLRENARSRVLNGAHFKAAELYERYVAIGLFEWAPRVKLWFNDPSYISWLELSSSNPPL